jgi:hypothetical protein
MGKNLARVFVAILFAFAFANPLHACTDEIGEDMRASVVDRVMDLYVDGKSTGTSAVLSIKGYVYCGYTQFECTLLWVRAKQDENKFMVQSQRNDYGRVWGVDKKNSYSFEADMFGSSDSEKATFSLERSGESWTVSVHQDLVRLQLGRSKTSKRRSKTFKIELREANHPAFPAGATLSSSPFKLFDSGLYQVVPDSKQ